MIPKINIEAKEHQPNLMGHDSHSVVPGSVMRYKRYDSITKTKSMRAIIYEQISLMHI